MMDITCLEILKATKGTLVCGSESTIFEGIITDSRKQAHQQLFIPIVGEKFDGHEFIQASFEMGAVATLTHKDIEIVEGKTIIKVKDTLAALADIARYYREKFSIPFIAVTGSVGKTTTKDIIASILEQQFKVLKTQGNFNNEIGLPLTLFNLDKPHTTAVIEMGMSNFGEISRLTSIVKPQIAVITNIGLSHIENLGSSENILKAKLEILESLSNNGLVILNGDDPMLSKLKDKLKFRTVFYGIEDWVNYRAYNIKSNGEEGTNFCFKIGDTEYKAHLKVPGAHNVYNALAGVAVGIELGMNAKEIIEGIENFSADKMRLNIINIKGLKIINDTYNASPHSMRAAIDVLSEMSERSRTIAVLGDMLEMGEWTNRAHIEVGSYVASKNIGILVAVGKNSKDIAYGALESGMNEKNIITFENNKQAFEFLKDILKEGDTVLVKGSRGMKMEQIIEQLSSEV